ncbi:hypothetical protein [Streptomyces sp. NPDC005438]|uniref:hypothetical protein n=1 Tax=Streptomyces sp. NPDC005438 TaxID=3156880 RepID=UPI0033A20FD7
MALTRPRASTTAPGPTARARPTRGPVPRRLRIGAHLLRARLASLIASGAGHRGAVGSRR